jgi:hypothetical protein
MEMKRNSAFFLVLLVSFVLVSLVLDAADDGAEALPGRKSGGSGRKSSGGSSWGWGSSKKKNNNNYGGSNNGGSGRKN